ncbi:MAG: hypothetical protein Q4F07_04940 [Bacteroidales bacterium]|nr:hypothetical protein [Bacteroidales bacterium]
MILVAVTSCGRPGYFAGMKCDGVQRLAVNKALMAVMSAKHKDMEGVKAADMITAEPQARACVLERIDRIVDEKKLEFLLSADEGPNHVVMYGCPDGPHSVSILLIMVDTSDGVHAVATDGHIDLSRRMTHIVDTPALRKITGKTIQQDN